MSEGERLDRLAMLGGWHETDLLEAAALERGVCVRPMAYRRTDVLDGTSKILNVSCGSRAEAVCPPCARRLRSARRQQCREGWHLEEEPEAVLGELGPDRVPDEQEAHWLGEHRAELVALRDAALAAGKREEAADWAAALAGHLAEMAYLGVPIDDGPAGPVSVVESLAAEHDGRQADTVGSADTSQDEPGAEQGGESDGREGGSGRRVRSTARRQDAPDLPRRRVSARTLGRSFTGRDGRVFRPSMFITLTLPSYGRVRDGVPVDRDRYDYRRAARDALHFGKLFDRFVQNLRRVAGYRVQYFAAVEPQKRLTPHVHVAMRGTIPRAAVRQVVEATYHQVWWPPTDGVAVFEGEHLPVWHEASAGYVVPTTGEMLPSWEETLDALEADGETEPLHVSRFGVQLDIQGVLAGTADSDQRIRYLTKYLTKSLGDFIFDEADEDRDEDGNRLRVARQVHARRMLEALAWEPCSAECANWLRYGVMPKNAVAGLVPGKCPRRAHRPDTMGYGGRRVLVSRHWSPRTLGGVLRERRAWVAQALGLDDELAREADPRRYIWQRLKGDDPHLQPFAVRLRAMIAERDRNRAALDLARIRQEEGGGDGVS
ncbi:replication initiator [Nonomuraea endophytica]|uniref:replication initiator n=1 Tax=Nonomuraea endophytica TaxID=714136 RepID=UPI0037CBE596